MLCPRHDWKLRLGLQRMTSGSLKEKVSKSQPPSSVVRTAKVETSGRCCSRFFILIYLSRNVHNPKLSYLGIQYLDIIVFPTGIWPNSLTSVFRQQHYSPLVSAFTSWAETHKVAVSSHLEQQDLWHGKTTFLEVSYKKCSTFDGLGWKSLTWEPHGTFKVGARQETQHRSTIAILCWGLQMCWRQACN